MKKNQTIKYTVQVPVEGLAVASFHYDESDAFSSDGRLDIEKALAAAAMIALIERAARYVPQRILADAVWRGLHDGDEATLADFADQLALTARDAA